MKKIIKILTGLILSIFLLALMAEPCMGQNIQLIGPHLTDHLDDYTLDKVREIYDQMGADWVAVTILVHHDSAANPNRQGGLRELALKLRDHKFMPNIRIVSDYRSDGSWSIITPQQANSAAQGLQALSGIFPRDPIVVVLNEVNSDREWGNQQVDPQAYVDILREFVNNNSGYKIANSPMNTSLPEGTPNSLPAEQFWNQMATYDLGVLENLDILAFNAYALEGCADYSNCGRYSWRWETDNTLPSSIRGKPKILTEFGPDPNNISDTYYTDYATLIRDSDFSGLLAVTPLVLDLCTGEDWGWTAVSPNLSFINFYDFVTYAELTDDCIGETAELDIPPQQSTEWGTAVPGRNIPCRPLIYGQRPWKGMSMDQYSNLYFYNIPCFDPRTGLRAPLACPDQSGYPFDYSPWRPYPGDSGRAFYNTDKKTIINNPNAPYFQDQDVCYNLARLDELNNNSKSSDYYITTYCNPFPDLWDTIMWFPPKVPDGHEQARRVFAVLGQLHPWWTDHPGDSHATQIPFLGNSITSSREFTQNTQRMSLFVSDFLRGTVFWDRNYFDPKDPTPEEKRRILEESGPVRKLFPDKVFNSWDYRDSFAACRLFKDKSECRPEEMKPLHIDPIHDYVVFWKLDEEGTDPVSESDFNNLPDRRDADYPIRISGYYCGIAGEPYPELCADRLPEESIGWTYLKNMVYFPITSREDIPAIVDVQLTASWDESAGMPPGARCDPQTIEEYYEAIENIDWTRTYINEDGEEVTEESRAEGVCWSDTGRRSPLTGKSEYKVYKFHYIDLVYIPYIPETRELSEWAGLILTPHNLDWEEDDSVKQLQLPNSGNCNANEIARGGHGDTVAADWRHSLEYTPAEGERLLWFINEARRTAPDREWGCNPEDEFDWPNRDEFKDRFPKYSHEDAKIVTKIPYLTQIAQRTIGKAGIFKTLMPQGFNQEIITKITEITQGKTAWYELPGYGPAHFDYLNGLVNESVQEHWGCCPAPDIPPQQCGGSPGGPNCSGGGSCPVGTHHEDVIARYCASNGCAKGTLRCCFNEECTIAIEVENVALKDCTLDEDCSCQGGFCRTEGQSGEGCQLFKNPKGEMETAPCNCCKCHGEDCGPIVKDGLNFRGLAGINEADARFYYPYIGSIDLFRQYFMNSLNPAELASFGSGIIPGPDTPRDGTTLDYTLPYRNTNDAPNGGWDALVQRGLEELNGRGWTSNLLEEQWEFVRDQAIANGWSPVFVIALWFEESGASHFVEINRSNDALGCKPDEPKNLQQSLNCLFTRLPWMEEDTSFGEFMCRYSENKSYPCTFNLNPNFPGNLKMFYDILKG